MSFFSKALGFSGLPTPKNLGGIPGMNNGLYAGPFAVHPEHQQQINQEFLNTHPTPNLPGRRGALFDVEPSGPYLNRGMGRGRIARR